MKLNLKGSVLDEKGKEEFLAKVEQFTDVFSLRDEIGTCPFIEVHLKLKDETPFFVRPYPMREEQKKVIQKEMDRLEHLGITCKGLTGYSSLVVLVKWKNQNFDVIMDDTFIHLTAEEHMDDLIDLFKVLRKYGLKLSPHKCQFFKKRIVYMGLEFQVQGDKVCYTPLKDKCDAIRNLELPKTLGQTRAFCRMVNFLSSF